MNSNCLWSGIWSYTGPALPHLEQTGRPFCRAFISTTIASRRPILRMLTPTYTNDLIQYTRFSNVSMRTGHLLFTVRFVVVYSIMDYVPVPFKSHIIHGFFGRPIFLSRLLFTFFNVVFMQFGHTIPTYTLYKLFNYLRSSPFPSTDKENPDDGDYLFPSQKGKHLQPLAVNKLMKKWTSAINLEGNYGCHTLRKTFGDIQRTEFGVGFEIICKRFGHSNPSITMRYLGIQDKEVNGILLNEIWSHLFIYPWDSHLWTFLPIFYHQDRQ